MEPNSISPRSQRLLQELEGQAIALLSGGRADIAVGPDLDELLRLDLRGRPWAELVVAGALVDRRDDRADALLDSCQRGFSRSNDHQGIGYAEFVKGNWFLINRDLDKVAACYERSREYLGTDCPVNAARLAQIGLLAYDRGELPQAIAITEEALASARLCNSRRYEGEACLYLAFFSLITGAFDRADSLLEVAEVVHRELEDPLERVELPLVLGARGVLAALRGQVDRAEDAFAAALATADGLQAPSMAAIPRILRAEFMAVDHPTRSLADARQALDQLGTGETAWWRTWALRAQAVAAREAGDIVTSVHLLRNLHQDPVLNPLERGLTLLALGETLVRTNRPDEAAGPLKEALGLLQPLGARYVVVRCLMALAEAGPPRTERRRQALALVDDDPAYRQLLAGRSILRISMLGDAGIWYGEQRLRFPTRKAELAMYALALVPGGLHEEVLIDWLWGEAPVDRLRARLRTLLWQVRRTLGREAWRLVRRGRSINLDITDVMVDVIEIRREAESVLALPRAQVQVSDIERLIAQLTQPLLIGWQYEPWVESETEGNTKLIARLRQRLADAG